MARTNPGGEQSNPLPPDDVRAGEEDLVADLDAGEDDEFQPYVEWRGSVTYREITEDHWREAGVHDQGTVIWSRESPRLPLDQLSDGAVARLASEPDFHFFYEPPKEDD